MADPQQPLTVRLSEPGEVVAALPHLLGFRPRESLVLVSLRGPQGRRLGLTARVDLPPPEHRRQVVSGLVRSLLTDRPGAALLVVVSEAADEAAVPVGPLDAPHLDHLDLAHRDLSHRDLAHRDLAHEVVLALDAVGVPLREALLVRRDRWWSYDCTAACCAPEAGTPLPAGTSELAAASVVDGRLVEDERAALARRIAPVGFLAAEAMARACDEVGDELARRTAELGWDVLVEEGWAAVRAAVEAAGPEVRGGRLSDREVARLAWGLRDHDLRDRALTLSLGDAAAAAEVVWTELTRRSPAPLDAAPATLLAVSAWVRGDGALANVALERALHSEPSYTFAGLLRSALDACLSPAEMRRLIRQATGPLDARW
ncbi:DUF4192 domain-containing protein [Modestobacter sp. VKM Ac-2984]|uniref:DUF4192 domain-containing protein n=1 Tax=Modestobacter sp. VKM Ac-2984 TaxID=3004138 RepID=UPI0022AAE91F|nr:DUF4192 domain-containing protein [Modestobacter sp. VKM Ac-2984]MCZ2818549.1 DUF4192 domain-containing protein [Modestobacter sp. VKM Ac-2984]